MHLSNLYVKTEVDIFPLSGVKITLLTITTTADLHVV